MRSPGRQGHAPAEEPQLRRPHGVAEVDTGVVVALAVIIVRSIANITIDTVSTATMMLLIAALLLARMETAPRPGGVTMAIRSMSQRTWHATSTPVQKALHFRTSVESRTLRPAVAWYP